MNSRKGVSLPINSTAIIVMAIVFVAIIVVALSTVIEDQAGMFNDLVDSQCPDSVCFVPLLLVKDFLVENKYMEKLPV